MVRRRHKHKQKPVRKHPAPETEFDKYEYYKKSVQSPDEDVLFLERVYQELNQSKPVLLREDFCGTFAICCEWVRLNEAYKATGIDIDQEPLEYGKKNYFSELNAGQQDRILLKEQSVLDSDLPAADIACALNFSYFCFKDRATLKKYFQSVYNSLNENGLLFLDCFGGGKCSEANEEETEYEDEKFSYFWDQDSFDPVSNFAQFYIHFKRYGEKKRGKVFSYDWRMWSIPELRDLLKEAGFSETHVYWEGTDEDGDGDGVFSRVQTGEECEAWVAYVIAKK